LVFLRRLIVTLTILWIAGCFLSFLWGSLNAMSPGTKLRGLPVPWSAFNDYVESADGKVLVDVAFHGVVEWYDREGGFVATLPYPGGYHKDTELAAGADGRVFFRALNRVYTLSPDWKIEGVVEVDASQPCVWELDELGKPRHSPERAAERAPRRLLRPGDVLFSSRPDRQTFDGLDGTRLLRVGDELERRSADGALLATYGTPAALRPFVFPFPAIFVWFGGIVVAFWVHLRDRSSRRRADRDPGHRPA